MPALTMLHCNKRHSFTYFLAASFKFCIPARPMDEREYDIVVYGANGCAAGHIIRELEHSTYRIALAARSEITAHKTSLPAIRCAIADLQGLARRTRLLINCAGPYAETGHAIIGACIAASTHYIDISGETHFLRETKRLFDDDARSSGVKVVQACGFDSVPADIGTMHLTRFMDSAAIDGTLRFRSCKANKTTWESLLSSLAQRGARRTAADHPSANDATNREGPERAAAPKAYRYNTKARSYDAAFMGCDPYIVKRSSEYFRKLGACSTTYTAYISIGSALSLAIYFVLGCIVSLLVKHPRGRKLLLAHYRLFTLGLVQEGGPSAAEISNASFELELIARGKRGANQVQRMLKVTGPDPSSLSTSIFATQCAYALLENEKAIDSGVLTPAQAFHRTKIVERLECKGIGFRLCDL